MNKMQNIKERHFIENDNIFHVPNEIEDDIPYSSNAIDDVNSIGTSTLYYSKTADTSDDYQSNEQSHNDERYEGSILTHIREIVLESFEKCKFLDDQTRYDLIENVLDWVLGEQRLLTNWDINNIANLICSIYTSEEKDIYYFERKNNVSAGGRLYNRYHTKLKKMRAKNQIQKSRRTINKIAKLNEENETYIISESEMKSIDFLCQNEFKDLRECWNHWKITFDYRQDILKDSDRDISNIIIRWNVLKLSIGHMLICEDFKNIHGGESSMSLRINWEVTFSEEKFELLNSKVKDSYTKRMIDELPRSTECRNCSLVYTLNAILYPPLQKNNWRPTIKDAINSIIQKADGKSEIERIIAKRHTHMKERKLESHPFIILVQHKDEEPYFIVVCHNYQYNFQSFIQAMDVCYKIFITFKIKFPLESNQFYTILNELFYKNNLNVKRSAKVLTLVQELQLCDI